MMDANQQDYTPPALNRVCVDAIQLMLEECESEQQAEKMTQEAQEILQTLTEIVSDVEVEQPQKLSRER